ncbi:Hsp20/alpha crystallin family protein [Sorangium sp. KYC3313]|uniref:Hsp20/alpha crystallin family protein n=1 Tax=Sorangium sp. KYC3313 TaxID=3449740 RepID=UPI003F8AD496
MNVIRRHENKPALSGASLGSNPWSLMRAMLEWDPFREMVPMFSRSAREALFTPDFDVKESGNAYVFKADLPGMQEKDVDVSFTGNRLTVSGKREEERREEKERYYSFERSYGTFSRSFTLPAGVDVERATAALKHGVLTVTVPETPETQPWKIPVQGPAPAAGREQGTKAP